MGLRTSREVRGINRCMPFLTPENNHTMIKWIEEYLRRIKKIYTNIKYYTVTITGNKQFHHKTYRLLVYSKTDDCYDLTLYNFKKFCRRNKLGARTKIKNYD